MATYLLTGVAGFIASKVCEFLLADGHTVVGIDNLNDYYDVRLKDWRLGQLLGSNAFPLGDSPKLSVYLGRGRMDNGEKLKAETLTAETKAGRFVFEQIDIEDLASLDRLFAEFKFDAVFNLAARAGVRYSMENPHVYLSTNMQGTLNLLECQRKHGVKKMVLASTSSLYAGCPMPFTEDQPVNTPLSPYAASKKAAEMMAYSYHKLYGIDVTVVRYFTVFGPAGRPDMAPFRFIKWIQDGMPIRLFGDGLQSRDFTFVDDIARGTVLAAKRLGYEILNLGGGNNPISLAQLIELIERSTGKKARLTKRDFHPADVRETWADITKAERCLGWRPSVSTEEGVARTVAWHREHAAWLDDIHI